MAASPIIIAIDGFSSTGKSTVARQLAGALHYTYIDTGAMYRAVTVFALENNLISDTHFDKEGLTRRLDELELNFERNPRTGSIEIQLNGSTVEHQIRTMRVSSFVSPVATLSSVRRKLVEQQQRMGKDKGIVMDGRDIGTIVFPDAALKIFMTASAEDRAQRRYKELLEKGEAVTFEEVLENVRERDRIDSTREDSPLQKAEDAIVIDNSNLTLDQQFETILQLAQEKLQNRQT